MAKKGKSEVGEKTLIKSTGLSNFNYGNEVTSGITIGAAEVIRIRLER